VLNSNNFRRVFASPAGEPPQVEAVILYEDFDCGFRLKQAFDGLFGEVFGRAGSAARYRLSLWSLQMLRSKPISTAAARESARAAVFCVAVLRNHHLTREAVSQVRHWLAHRKEQPSAVVLASYGANPATLLSSPAGAYLRMAAARTGKTFLVHPLGEPRLGPLRPTPGSARRAPPRPPPATLARGGRNQARRESIIGGSS